MTEKRHRKLCRFLPMQRLRAELPKLRTSVDKAGRLRVYLVHMATIPF